MTSDVTPDRDFGPFRAVGRRRHYEPMAASTLSVPTIDRSSTWVLDFADDPASDSVNAARLSITDGCVGSQSVSETGSRSDDGEGTVRVAGVHGPEPPGLLLSSAAWTPLGWAGRGISWSLDLRTGVVGHRLGIGGRELETQRWAIAGHPGSQAFIAPVSDGRNTPLTVPATSLLSGPDGRLAAVAVADRRVGEHYLRVASSCTAASTASAVSDASDTARRLVEQGPESLTAQQQRAWARRWTECNVTIDGDPMAELRTRFALFHLLALSDHGPQLPVGARGLTGEAYGGHVFWDADVFVLPSLASLAPSAARAMIEYRLRRLDSARSFAESSGDAGARYPWESAASGRDVTPRWYALPNGEPMAIQTGQQELHISADVAWGIRSYELWTDDHDVLRAGGAEATVDIARYLASVITTDDRGGGHITGVIGPDEYHENVDDNAFTNRMTAWTLRRACELAAEGYGPMATTTELRQWSELASSIATGYDGEQTRHLQFIGYDHLDPILAATIADPPFAADLLLGSEAVQRSQLIKQADVLMMHHLIPDEMPEGSLQNDIAYYLPRTAHGSSLSPAVHAAVLARAGRPDEALHWYRIALGLDLDDLTGTGAGGLHYANFGGVWQALLIGFLGLRPCSAGLMVDPALPAAWDRLAVRCRYRGTSLEVDADRERVEITTGEPVSIVNGAGRPAGRATRICLVPSDEGWVAR